MQGQTTFARPASPQTEKISQKNTDRSTRAVGIFIMPI